MPDSCTPHLGVLHRGLLCTGGCGVLMRALAADTADYLLTATPTHLTASKPVIRAANYLFRNNLIYIIYFLTFNLNVKN